MVTRRALWLLYAAFIVYGGLIPFAFTGDLAAALERARHVPLNPLLAPSGLRRLSIPDAVQNVLFFVPFGALGVLALARRTRDRSGVARRIVLASVAGFLLSVLVESLQLLTADRVASLGDVLCDTIGTLLGGAAAWLGGRAATRAWHRLRVEGLTGIPELRPLAVAVAVLMVAWWQPFDATLDVSTAAGKVRAFQSDAWQFTGLRDEGMSVMLSVFVASTLASYLSAVGEGRPALKAAGLGAGFVCGLEASQVLIGSRMPGLWDAAVACAGIGLGAAIWAGSARLWWPRLWLGVIVAATAAASAMQNLSPFELAPAYRTMGWFPFLGYYSHTTFETLSHVIELALLYFPLGFWIGRDPGRPWARLATALLLTLAIAGPIEYLQGWVVGRYPDVTDVGVSLLGAVASWRAASARTSA